MERSSVVRSVVLRVVVVGLVLGIAWFFSRPPVVEVSQGDVVIVKHSRPSLGGGDDALVSGVLTVDEDGCLGLDGSVTVFPFWTRITDTDPVTIRVFGETNPLGAQVEGGGGYSYGRNHVAWLDRCIVDPSEEVGVFN
jgi:hypothetical protein